MQAYTDNRLDVAQLLEDSDQKGAAVEQLASVEEELSQTLERLQEVENESISKIAELQKQLQERTTEISSLSVSYLLSLDILSIGELSPLSIQGPICFMRFVL